MSLLELGDGLVPLLVVRLAVGEEHFEQLDEVAAVADVLVQPLTDAVLEEDCTLGSLEDDVVSGVALVELGADFFFQVVVLVLGLPVTARQAEGVEQGAVNA